MHRDRIGVYGIGILLTFLGFVVAYQFVEPAPPDHIRLATGSPGGAYNLFGQRYRALLADEGISVELVESAGSVANLRSLMQGSAHGGVDVAFVQGGTAKAPGEAEVGLSSLGSLYYEPLWIFVRRGDSPEDLRGLAGVRVAVGPEGSGTRPVAIRLLNDNGIGLDDSATSPLAGEAAHEALRNGTVDAVMTVAGLRAPAVQAMLADPAVQPVSLPRAEGLALRHPFLSVLRLPRGAFDPARDVPGYDLTLLAPAATLVARNDVHPALATLLLRAASRVHGDGGLFEPQGAFPAPGRSELPLSDEARRFYEQGTPFLQRFMPFWAADLVDRLKVMLIPLITLMLPLFKILPPAYRWRVRSRIYRSYRDLLEIEAEAKKPDGSPDLAALKQRLQKIDDTVSHVSVPLSYADAAYSLRMHIDLVRTSLERLETGRKN